MSSKRVTNQQIDRFLTKWQVFGAWWSVLVIETDESHQMRQCLGQLGQAMAGVDGDASVGAIERVCRTSIVRLRESELVADTGNLLSEMLRGVVGR